MTHWQNTNVQADLGGNEHPPARYSAHSTRADSKFDEREMKAWVFTSLCAVSPVVILAFFVAVVRLFS